MLPAIALSTFSLVLFLLSGIIIPVCNFAFWNETKDFIISVARDWFEIHASDPKTMVMILWAVLAIFAGFYEILFLNACDINYYCLVTAIGVSNYLCFFFRSDSVVFRCRHIFPL